MSTHLQRADGLENAEAIQAPGAVQGGLDVGEVPEVKEATRVRGEAWSSSPTSAESEIKTSTPAARAAMKLADVPKLEPGGPLPAPRA